MRVRRTPLEIVRGNSWDRNIVFRPQDPEEVIVLSEAYFSVKAHIEDSEYIFQKSLGDGITMVEDNVYAIHINPTDTEIELGDYFYDITLIAEETNEKTVLSGILSIVWGVTQ